MNCVDHPKAHWLFIRLRVIACDSTCYSSTRAVGHIVQSVPHSKTMGRAARAEPENHRLFEGEPLQTKSELDNFYKVSDPWAYFQHADDARRRNELLAVLPKRQWGRVLDIGCGNGFITLTLPGRAIVGVDFSAEAVRWARDAAAKQADQERFRFEVGSLLDPELVKLGHFDLVVVTGVLYEQYVGKAWAFVRWILDQLTQEGSIVATCHIREWIRMRPPYSLIDMTMYPYREYTHQLEIFRR